MARLAFPDDRLVYGISGTFVPSRNSTVTVYTDATGQTLADISLTVNGTSIAGSTVVTDAYSRMPVFYGPPDGTDTLYVVVNGGPVSPVYARVDDRLDAINTSVAGKAATSYVDAQDTATLGSAHTYTDAEASRATAAEASRINYRGAWAATTAYAANDAVSYNGGFYRSLAGFTSGGTFNASNWHEIVPQSGTYALPDVVVSKTANYAANAGEYVLCNTTGGGFTVTLPASPTAGQIAGIKKTSSDANLVTISPNVDGGSITIATQNHSLFVEYDGTAWRARSGHYPKGTFLFTAGPSAGSTETMYVDDPDNNLAIGKGAFAALVAGATQGNTAFGYNAMASTSQGGVGLASDNTAMGYLALFSNTTGDDCSAFGAAAAYANTTGRHNSAFGEAALHNNSTGDDNTAVGFAAMYGTVGGNPTWSVGVGRECLLNINNATQVVAVGYQTAFNLTNGGSTVAVGYQALFTVTTNGQNTAIGAQALYSGTAASQTAVGYQALKAGGGGTSVAVGAFALTASTGQSNVALGYNALGSMVLGNHHTAVGASANNALNANISNTTAVGWNTVASAAGTVAIGVDSAGTAASATVQDGFVLGTALHTVKAIGNAVIGGSGKTVALFGGTGVTQPARAGQLTDSSGGTSGGNTIAAVTDVASAANAIATLAAKINAIEGKLSAAGTGIGVTA